MLSGLFLSPYISLVFESPLVFRNNAHKIHKTQNPISAELSLLLSLSLYLSKRRQPSLLHTLAGELFFLSVFKAFSHGFKDLEVLISGKTNKQAKHVRPSQTLKSNQQLVPDTMSRRKILKVLFWATDTHTHTVPAKCLHVVMIYCHGITDAHFSPVCSSCSV